MATDHVEKKAALEARLTMLDADAARIAQKRKDTEAQLAALGTKSEAPVKAAKK